MAKRTPIFPLIDGGNTRLQPVWVRDVAAGARAVGAGRFAGVPAAAACGVAGSRPSGHPASMVGPAL